MIRGKVPWDPNGGPIEVEMRPKRTYYRGDASSLAEELRREIQAEFLHIKKHPSSDAKDMGYEHFSLLTKSFELHEKALHGDIESGKELSKIVTAKVTNNQKLDGAEESYFKRAIKEIADGEQPDVAFLAARKNGKRDESHIPDRDRWIYEEFCNQLDSGRKFSEAANLIHATMAMFHYRAESELEKAEASGIVRRVEEAKRLLRINTQISPERLGDIFVEQGFKHRRLMIDLYLQSRALRKQSKVE